MLGSHLHENNHYFLPISLCNVMNAQYHTTMFNTVAIDF